MKTEKNIFVAFLLNLSFSLIELIGGIFTHSIAIISDSVHDFGDSLSILISYFLEKKSKNKADNKYTYGYKRYSVLGAAITNTVLITGSIIVIYNSILRIINPVVINHNGMIILAVIGVIINFMAAYFTRRGDSLNQKAVNLHMFEDVLGWAIVLVGAILIKLTNINLIDPIMSIMVALYIVTHAAKNFEIIINLFLEKAPNDISIDKMKEDLLKLKNVVDIHHIHIWSIDGFANYATMHVVTNGKDKNVKEEVRKTLKLYHIEHATLELEDEKEKCLNASCSGKINVVKHKH